MRCYNYACTVNDGESYCAEWQIPRQFTRRMCQLKAKARSSAAAYGAKAGFALLLPRFLWRFRLSDINHKKT